MGKLNHARCPHPSNLSTLIVELSRFAPAAIASELHGPRNEGRIVSVETLQRELPSVPAVPLELLPRVVPHAVRVHWLPAVEIRHAGIEEGVLAGVLHHGHPAISRVVEALRLPPAYHLPRPVECHGPLPTIARQVERVVSRAFDSDCTTRSLPRPSGILNGGVGHHDLIALAIGPLDLDDEAESVKITVHLSTEGCITWLIYQALFPIGAVRDGAVESGVPVTYDNRKVRSQVLRFFKTYLPSFDPSEQHGSRAACHESLHYSGHRSSDPIRSSPLTIGSCRILGGSSSLRTQVRCPPTSRLLL